VGGFAEGRSRGGRLGRPLRGGRWRVGIQRSRPAERSEALAPKARPPAEGRCADAGLLSERSPRAEGAPAAAGRPYR
jgi:hypothetical protein